MVHWRTSLRIWLTPPCSRNTQQRQVSIQLLPVCNVKVQSLQQPLLLLRDFVSAVRMLTTPAAKLHPVPGSCLLCRLHTISYCIGVIGLLFCASFPDVRVREGATRRKTVGSTSGRSS